MTLKESGVRLVAEGTNTFLGNMKKATNAVNVFGKDAGTVSQAITTMGGAVGSAAKILGKVFVGGVAAAGAGIAFATKEAISLESAFAGVIKTTDGLADSTGALTSEGEGMLQGFRDLAKEVPTSIEELMAIGELGGQLGIAKESLLDFTGVIAAMGEATNLTTEEAAVGFAQIANVMGTPQEMIENMGSAVVALGNNMATTERDIFNFAQRIAGAGEIAGLTEAQVFGISAAFSSVGIEAAAGGTAVQKVLLDINQAVLDGSEQLDVYAEVAGVTTKEFADAWEVDAGGAFTAFVDGLGKAGDDAVGILSDLGLEDQRLIKAFLSLAQAGGVTNDEISLLADAIGVSTDAFAENTALMTEAEARYRTTESQIGIFKNTLRDIGFTIGGLVLPFLTDLISALSPLAEAFNFLIQGDIAGFFEGVWFAMQDLAVAFGFTQEQGAAFAEFITGIIQNLIDFKNQIVAAAAPIVEWLQVTLPQAIAFVTEHWEAFKGALIAIGAVLAAAGIVTAIAGIVAALNPVTLVIGAIVAAAALLGAAWAENWGGIRDVVTEIWENTLQPALAELWEWLQVNIPVAIETLSQFWVDTLQPALETVWAFIVDSVLPTLGDIVAWLATNIPVAIETASDFWENTLQPALEVVWEFIEGDLIPIIESVVDWLATNIPEAINTASDFWENTLQPALETVWSFIQDDLIPIIEDVITIISEGWRIALEAISIVWEETLKPALETVWDFISENILPIFEEVSDFVSGSAVEAIAAFVTDGLDLLAEGLKLVNTWLKKVVGWIAKLADAVKAFSWGDLGDGAMPESPPKLAVGFAMISDEISRFREELQVTKSALGQGVISSILSEQGQPLDDLLKAGRTLGGFASNFARMFESRTLGPARKRLDDLQKKLQETLLAEEKYGESLFTIMKKAALTASIAREQEKIAQGEEKILQLQKQQQDLGFLQEQMKLLSFVREHGLDPSVLGDIDFGLEASIPDLMEATSNAMAAVISAANQELMGDTSEGAIQGAQGIAGSMFPSAGGTTTTSGAQIVNNIQNSRDIQVSFEGNYLSNPAIQDQDDLSLMLGLAGV